MRKTVVGCMGVLVGSEITMFCSVVWGERVRVIKWISNKLREVRSCIAMLHYLTGQFYARRKGQMHSKQRKNQTLGVMKEVDWSVAGWYGCTGLIPYRCCG